MYCNLDGQVLEAGNPVLATDNRGFLYGEGIFETMRVAGGTIALEAWHWERLFAGLRLLHFLPAPNFTSERLREQVLELCRLNGHEPARARLTIFRGPGGLFDTPDPLPHYIIQSSVLKTQTTEQGLCIGIYPDGRKAMDALSNLKSNNYLLYVMAANYAREQGWDDCLVLNSGGRICESSISNIFCIRERVVYTPPLSEGPVAGVMRREVVALLQEAGISLSEEAISPDFLEGADEIFLTNALRGIRSVERFAGRTYDQTSTNMIRGLLGKDLR